MVVIADGDLGRVPAAHLVNTFELACSRRGRVGSLRQQRKLVSVDDWQIGWELWVLGVRRNVAGVDQGQRQQWEKGNSGSELAMHNEVEMGRGDRKIGENRGDVRDSPCRAECGLVGSLAAACSRQGQERVIEEGTRWWRRDVDEGGRRRRRNEGEAEAHGNGLFGGKWRKRGGSPRGWWAERRRCREGWLVMGWVVGWE
jgi:hypothetical protein